MSGVIGALNAYWQAYGRPVLLALLLHGMLLAALLHTKFTPVAMSPLAEPVVSYLYEPPVSVYAEPPQSPDAENTAVPETIQPASAANAAASAVIAEQQVADDPAAEPLPDTQIEPGQEYAGVTTPTPRQGLAQRAFNRVATVDPAAIEQAATAGYQQLLKAQQQPKMTVEKRHQELSTDPAKQVVSQLDDGRQLIRTKGGCRVADPSKHGFDALMAARRVRCGDEDDRSTSALLQQALEKHVKR